METFGGYNCKNELIPLQPLADYAERDAMETAKILEKYKDLIIAGLGVPKEYLEPPEYNPRDYMGLPPPVSPTEFIEKFGEEEVGVADYTTSSPTEIPSFAKWALPMIRNIYPKMIAKEIVTGQPTFGGPPSRATFPREYPADYSTPPPQEIDIKLTSTTIKARARKLKAKWTTFEPPRTYPDDYSSVPQACAGIPASVLNKQMRDGIGFVYAPYIPMFRTPVLRKDYFGVVTV